MSHHMTNLHPHEVHFTMRHRLAVEAIANLLAGLAWPVEQLEACDRTRVIHPFGFVSPELHGRLNAAADRWWAHIAIAQDGAVIVLTQVPWPDARRRCL